MARARTVAEVIAGEAVSGTEEQRIADMRAIASVIANRAALLGVTPEQVVSNTNEFNAYNRSLPPGVGQQLIDMAQEQVDYVAENGPVNNATFYATPNAVDNLPNGLSYEDATTGHQYFSDPQNRPELRIPSGTNVDARVEHAAGRVTVFGQVRNLFDTLNMLSLGSPTSGEAEDPRTFAVGIESRF